MDLDSLYFSSLLKSKKPRYLKGVKPEFFEGRWRQVFKFVSSFYSEHHRLPKLATVKQKFKDRPFFRAHEKPPFYAAEIHSRYSLWVMDEHLQEKFTPARARGDLDGSVTAMKEAVLCVERAADRKGGGLLRTRKGIAQRRKEYLLRKKRKGILGIPTPWKALNMVTQGWQKGDLAIVLARPGLGKTFMALLLMLHAQLKGYHGLFASMEMRPERLIVRYDGLGAGVSVERFRKGRLKKSERIKMNKWYAQLQSGDGMGELDLAGPGEISSPLDLELAINLGKYDFVVWDAFYLASRKKKWEDFAQLVADIKNVATKTGVPILLTSQFNKDVKIKHAHADISAAAFTDSIVQDADFVFAMFQTPPMKMMNEMVLRSLKIREGVDLSEMQLRWDIDHGDFSELNASLLTDTSGDPEIDNEADIPYAA